MSWNTLSLWKGDSSNQAVQDSLGREQSASSQVDPGSCGKEASGGRRRISEASSVIGTLRNSGLRGRSAWGTIPCHRVPCLRHKDSSSMGKCLDQPQMYPQYTYYYPRCL
ncbi:hypothetical protein VULLAG_LOCUS22876 [Vulpes lagopus]